jgi:pimeloyl-ACP methyl ester carboxylesterase
MAGAEEWVEILPNARLFKISDSGHLPFVEQPEIFYPAVEQFLNGEWPEN